jgi:hypothetical protein
MYFAYVVNQEKFGGRLPLFNLIVYILTGMIVIVSMYMLARS